MPIDPKALPEFSDENVQAVYRMLCPDGIPDTPKGDHWEGWTARHIVTHFDAEISRLTEALRMAREAIAGAPHSKECSSLISGYYPGEDGFRQRGFPYSCDCWKSRALAAIDQPAAPAQPETEWRITWNIEGHIGRNYILPCGLQLNTREDMEKFMAVNVARLPHVKLQYSTDGGKNWIAAPYAERIDSRAHSFRAG